MNCSRQHTAYIRQTDRVAILVVFYIIIFKCKWREEGLMSFSCAVRFEISCFTDNTYQIDKHIHKHHYTLMGLHKKLFFFHWHASSTETTLFPYICDSITCQDVFFFLSNCICYMYLCTFDDYLCINIFPKLVLDVECFK